MFEVLFMASVDNCLDKKGFQTQVSLSAINTYLFNGVVLITVRGSTKGHLSCH